MRVLVLSVLWAVSLGGLTGCLSSLSQTSARTLDKGQTEFTGTIGAIVIPPEDYAPPALPLVQVQVRHGVHDRIEFGGVINPMSIGGRVKFGLVRSESETSGFNLSLEPGGQLYYFPSAVNGAGEVALPLHVGIRFGGTEFTFGPRVGMIGPLGEGAWNPYVGGTMALAFKVTDRFLLTPEVGLTKPLGVGSAEPMFPTFGLGFTWGR